MSLEGWIAFENGIKQHITKWCFSSLEGIEKNHHFRRTIG